MKRRVVRSPADVARAAANLIAETLRGNPKAILGLPTGRTAVGVYDELVRLHTAGFADFSQAHTVNIDELAGIPPEDDRSFCGFMRAHLFSRVNLPPSHVHFLDGSARDLDKECARFERDIASLGGIDLLLLGIGANAHIAFNEPGTQLEARTHVVTLTEVTRRANRGAFGGRTRLVPRRALTMGVGTLLEAREILLIAAGAEKSRAVVSMFSGKVSSLRPASFLQLHGNAGAILDAAAAKQLPKARFTPKFR